MAWKYQNYLPVDYDLGPSDLVLDPAAIGTTIDHPLKFFCVDDAPWLDRSEEVERVMRHAVILFHSLGGLSGDPVSFAECLETAIIWERG